MKHFLILLLFICYTLGADAQQYILSGRVTKKNNQPANNAAIQVVNNTILKFTYSDSNGLYFTEMLPEGLYEVNIVADSVTYLTKVTIKRPTKKNKFYNIKLTEKGAILTETEDDPFLEAALAKARKSPQSILKPGQHYQIIKVKRDSTDRKKKNPPVK